MAASAASRELLAEGVRAVLRTWPVLQIAVDQGFGGVYGQQKADWMVDVVQQYFHDNADLQQYEVEDFLSDLLDHEFNTVVDDGSLPQVCGSLMTAFSQWSRGEHQELRNHIQVLNQRTGRVSVRAPPPEDEDTPPGEDSDHEDTQVMEVDSSRTEAPPPPPEAPPPPPEDDGWTVVRKRK